MTGAVTPPQWCGNRSAIHALSTLAKHFHLVDCIIYYMRIHKQNTMSTRLQQLNAPYIYCIGTIEGWWCTISGEGVPSRVKYTYSRRLLRAGLSGRVYVFIDGYSQPIYKGRIIICARTTMRWNTDKRKLVFN